MKRITGIVVKVFIGLILVILVTAFTVPLIFKEKIKAEVEKAINESVNAKVGFEDYSLGFFRNFPNLAFSLEGLSIVGIDRFENDTLASFKSMNMVFNLVSLFKKSGYEIRSVTINNAMANAIVLGDGSANWDIMKESDTPESADESSSAMKILLKRVEVINSSVSYIDYSSEIETYIDKMDFNLKGDMTMS